MDALPLSRTFPPLTYLDTARFRRENWVGLVWNCEQMSAQGEKPTKCRSPSFRCKLCLPGVSQSQVHNSSKIRLPLCAAHGRSGGHQKIPGDRGRPTDPQDRRPRGQNAQGDCGCKDMPYPTCRCSTRAEGANVPVSAPSEH